MIPRVAVVGGAPCTIPYGEIIDQCEIVIRFNKFKTEGYERYVGSKTTIWCYSSNIFDLVRGQPRDDFNTTWIVQRPVVSPAMLNDARRRNTNTYLVPREFDDEVTKRLRAFPSTGVVALYTAITLFGGPVLAVGFRSFRKYQKLHYFEERDVNPHNTPHNGDAERLFIAQLRNDGHILPAITL